MPRTARFSRFSRALLCTNLFAHSLTRAQAHRTEVSVFEIKMRRFHTILSHRVNVATAVRVLLTLKSLAYAAPRSPGWSVDCYFKT